MSADHTTRQAKRQWYKDTLFLPVFLVVLGLDQLTKYLVAANLRVGESIPDQGIFRITHITNTGSAFGLFPNQTLVLIVASFIGIGFLIYYYHVHPFPNVFLRLSLGLQLGGAIGNLIDRVRQGYVTDFISLGWWPAFNIADSSIVVGICIIAWVVLIPGGKEKPAEPSTEDTPTAVDTKRPQ